MSTDHKDSGWRKRQIALDKKAENARELGLDYEPSIIEMARRAGAVFPADGSYHKFERHKDLETFAKLVIANNPPQSFMSWQEGFEAGRLAERERIAKWYEGEGHMSKEALIARLKEEATYDLNHQTIALLIETADALAQPAQRAWVGLTDDELSDIWFKQSTDWMEFARVVEAKLKEKNFD